MCKLLPTKFIRIKDTVRAGYKFPFTIKNHLKNKYERVNYNIFKDIFTTYIFIALGTFYLVQIVLTRIENLYQPPFLNRLSF